MQLRPGQKLRSAVCDAQVVVVRSPSVPVDLRCGGAPLVEEGQEPPMAAELDPTLGDGPLLGKRYADEAIGVEVLCSRPGTGALTADGTLLPVKGAKPLPSSD